MDTSRRVVATNPQHQEDKEDLPKENKYLPNRNHQENNQEDLLGGKDQDRPNRNHHEDNQKDLLLLKQDKDRR